MAACKRQVLEESSLDGFTLEPISLTWWQEIDQREEIGLWIKLDHLLDDPLGSTVDIKPFMDDGNARCYGSIQEWIS
jgi:hypothetical protein